MNKMPHNAKHILLVLPIPIGYPDMFLIDTVFAVGDRLPFVDGILSRLGLKTEIDYELRDDFLDHWNHSNHEVERDILLEKCFELNNDCRLTILSGDVHHMAVGLLKSKSNNSSIFNIVSSGIGNIPPGSVEAKFLSSMSFFHHVNPDISMQLTDKRTKISWPFGDKSSQVTQQIINKRNYLILELNQNTKNQDCLFFVERSDEQFPEIYSMTVQPNKQ